MGSSAQTRTAARPATAFDEFAERYLARLKRTDRTAALSALKAVVLEAQATERRRLCTDGRYFAAAQALTRDEILRHGARPRGARIGSHLASRVRSARSRVDSYPAV